MNYDYNHTQIHSEIQSAIPIVDSAKYRMHVQVPQFVIHSDIFSIPIVIKTVYRFWYIFKIYKLHTLKTVMEISSAHN